MNLEQLHHIVEVARFKSLSKAAVSLHITQSGLSQSISALEAELGIALFKRSRLGAHPTHEGKVIIEKAMDMIALQQDIVAEARHWDERLTGSLRLAGLPGVMVSFIRTAAYMKRKHPSVTLEITEKGSFQIIEDMKAGKLDAGFVAMNEEMLEKHGEWHFRPVIQGKMVACASRSSSLCVALGPGRTLITPEQLREQPFILYNDDYVHWFMKDFTKKYGEVDVLFKTGNGSAITWAMQEGLGVTIGHDYSFYNHPLVVQGEFVMLELEKYEQQPVYMGWIAAHGRQDQLLQEVVEQIDEDLKKGSYLS